MSRQHAGRPATENKRRWMTGIVIPQKNDYVPVAPRQRISLPSTQNTTSDLSPQCDQENNEFDFRTVTLEDVKAQMRDAQITRSNLITLLKMVGETTDICDGLFVRINDDIKVGKIVGFGSYWEEYEIARGLFTRIFVIANMRGQERNIKLCYVSNSPFDEKDIRKWLEFTMQLPNLPEIASRSQVAKEAIHKIRLEVKKGMRNDDYSHLFTKRNRPTSQQSHHRHRRVEPYPVEHRAKSSDAGGYGPHDHDVIHPQHRSTVGRDNRHRDDSITDNRVGRDNHHDARQDSRHDRSDNRTDNRGKFSAGILRNNRTGRRSKNVSFSFS